MPIFFTILVMSYHPVGSEKISDNRLFGMFHASTPEYNKAVILRSLGSPDGVVRIVFATVALGMGVDLRDVNTVGTLWRYAEY